MEFKKNIWKWEFWKLNLKIGILKKCLKMEVLKIKFENGNFGKLLENGSFENWNFEKWEFWKIIWKWKFWKLKIWKIVWEWNLKKNYLRIKFLKN